MACVWHSGEELEAMPAFVASSQSTVAGRPHGPAGGSQQGQAGQVRPPAAVMAQVDRCLALAARTRR